MARNAKTSRTVRSSVLATHPGMVLALVAIVSVAAHAAAALAWYDQPLGRVDPSALTQVQRPIRITRAHFDQFLEPGQSLVGDAATSSEDQPPSLAELSQTLLQQTQPPLPEPTVETEPDLVAPDVDESRPTQPAAALDVKLPPFELSDQILSQLAIRSPDDLAYQAGNGLGDGNGGGIGRGSATDRGGAGSAQARRLLQTTGLTTGVNPGAVPLAPLQIDDRPNLDRRQLDTPDPGPRIDFARLALDQTTRLEVPEHLDQDFDYAVTRYRNPNQPQQPGWFRVDITPRQSLHKLETMPKDMIFIIDTSSSLPQEWIDQMVKGVQQSLRMLNDDDRFNVVLFNDNPAFFSTGDPVPATVANIERGVRFLDGAQSQGYTNVNAALSQLLVRDVNAERVYELILISDGQPTRGVIDTRELINLITRNNDLQASIYCIGAGRRANRVLLNFLAYRNKGFSLFVEDRGRVAAVIRGLASRLRYPLIKDVRVAVAGKGVGQVFPVDLPNIHQGETFSLFGRFEQPGPFTMRVTGTSSGRNVDFTFTRNLSEAPQGEPSLSRAWAFWKLHHLYSEILRRGRDADLLGQIEHLRERYNLKTLY